MFHWLRKIDQSIVRASQSEPVITQNLTKIFLADDRLSIIDCGASGGSLKEWSRIASFIKKYGFDPDQPECERLNQEAKATGHDHYYYPIALAGFNQKGRTFYVTNHPQSSSLYKPDETYISRWRSYPDGKVHNTIDFMGLKKTITLDTTTLDTWASQHNIDTIDFIKMDVQGAELEILQGGKQLLSTVLGLIVEVWNVPEYEDLPLFADIDCYLRQQHFSFFASLVTSTQHYVGRNRSPVAFKHMTTFREQSQAGQLVTTDVVYLRDLVCTPYPTEKVQQSRVLKLICLAELCQQTEYAYELL